VLTVGFHVADNKQRSPMWGSLTLNRADGTQADYDVSSSTSQDWTYWNTRSYNLFAEYTHTLSTDWEAKFTVNHRRGEESTKIFYAYSQTGVINNDGTGLVGWPYRSEATATSSIVDGNLTGRFDAFGRKHEAVLGLSHSRQKNETDTYDATPYINLPLPAFPYAGNVFAEPDWGPRTAGPRGEQRLTRLYGATRLVLTDELKGIVGLNAVSLTRDGASIYGNGTVLDDSKSEKLSPYVGATYDFTRDVLGYASYSNIFQNQDQADINGAFLPPMKGVNAEVGVKAEWLDRRLLTTFAVFGARQEGLATYGGTVNGQYWYEGKDVKSRGYEIEVTGNPTADSRLTAGFTQLKLTGPDGNDIYEWVPRRTINVRAESRMPGLAALRLGVAARWQSEVNKIGGAKQDAYLLADAFAAYALTDAATLRFNVRNLADKKYLSTVQYGAIYGAPRHYALSIDYKL
jgi:outer-membrane receptor for ferric coprogen and ferric-rhodotorulic acid